MNKLKIGVIGLGMGRAHIMGYKRHPAAEITALADIDASRLEQTGAEFQVGNLYADAEEMLAKEKLDVVSVATPNKFHKPLAIAALRAGCHVLCEKPMAMNAREAREMLAASKKAKKRLMINFSFRFTEQSYAMKQQVDKGILGDIYYARTQWLRRRGMPGFGGWFGQKALAGGGPLIDLGVHRLDLALWLMKYPRPTWVMGGTYNHIARERAKAEGKAFDVEDMAAGFIRFANGATMSIEASWAGNIKDREYMHTQLLGTKAGLHQYNLNEGYDFECEFYLEKNGCQYDMKLHPPVPQAKNAMCHFIDSIVGNTPHIATGEEGLTVMVILDALYKSAASGKPVKV